MKGIPILFVVVVAATIAVTIFFGAWAVSVDAETRENDLSYAIVGAGSNLAVGTYESVEQREQKVAIGRDGRLKADTWWGKALIVACPLH